VLDALLARHVAGVEQQRPKDRRTAGIQELRRRDLTVVDGEATGGNLALKIAAQCGDPERRTTLVKIPTNLRHAFRDANHRAQRRHGTGAAQKLDILATQAREHCLHVALARIEGKDLLCLREACLVIDRIQHTVQPTVDQEAALDNLRAALLQARKIIKSSCPASVPLTPIGRLDAAEQGLDATIKAIQMVLSPLEKFYEALSDEQRGRFNAMNGSTEGARSASDMAALCSQQVGTFINLPAQRIEQVVQPTAQQKSAFDDLKKTVQKAGDQLQSSCPTAVPKSPVARLDTIETRLSAIADAIKAVRPNLKNFYASLSDEQKARLNMMGPSPPPVSSPH
jgi:hypothetical protein